MKSPASIPIKARLYAGLLAITGLTIWIVAAEGDSLLASGLAVVGVVYAILMSIYLNARSPMALKHELLGAGTHPSLGLLDWVPATWARLGRHAAAYVALAAAGYFFFSIAQASPFAPSPGDRAFLNIMGAMLMVAAATYFAFELLAVPMVRRWGANPPLGPLLVWFACSAFLGGICGVIVVGLVMERLASLPSLAPYLDLFGSTPDILTFLVGASLLWRYMAVSAWQSRLMEQTLRAEAAEQGRKVAEAQLAMLQAQIEPHFLYNTLASVQYLVQKDGKAADFLLTQLIRYLRHAMPRLRQPMSTLAQEFELADAYLQIARMRTGGRLTVSVELDTALHECQFPPLVVQTLVENALKHGVEPKVGPVRITVAAEVVDAVLRVSVIDNGVGLGRSPASTAGSGTGLVNIRERLQGIYGERARLSIAGADEGGVHATVFLDLAAAVGPAVGAMTPKPPVIHLTGAH